MPQKRSCQCSECGQESRSWAALARHTIEHHTTWEAIRDSEVGAEAVKEHADESGTQMSDA